MNNKQKVLGGSPTKIRAELGFFEEEKQGGSDINGIVDEIVATSN